MALDRRPDGKLETSTTVNPLRDLLNGMGRHDPLVAGHRPVQGTNETWIATVVNAISGSQGFYAGKLKLGDIAIQAGAITNADFGTDDITESVIIANLGEIGGGSALNTSGSAIVFGRFYGYNSLAIGGIGGATEDGLPIMVVSPGGGGSLPIGQYPDMMYGIVTINQGGLFFNRAHSMT